MNPTVGFLLARIAEEQHEAENAMRENLPPQGDEAWVIEADQDPFAGSLTGDMTCHPARVLGECEAKRKRVELLAQWDALCAPDDWPEDAMSDAALADAARHLLRIEALPYAAHPDYPETLRGR